MTVSIEMARHGHAVRPHGGPDALGPPAFDFSTNSNACGPNPHALQSIRQADVSCYPDPSYSALRRQLAAFHAVEPDQIVLAASGSAFIFLLTQVLARRASESGQWSIQVPARFSVCVPPHGFGDYASAAQAQGYAVCHTPEEAGLVWDCEPSSPLGQAANWPTLPARSSAVVALDCAYAPLRLRGSDARSAAQQAACWRLFSPNKALGLTGVRGAYAIAPRGAQALVADLLQHTPSWPLGVHAVALLQAWAEPATQSWLAQSLDTLRHWKELQCDWLQGLGWHCHPSDTPFFVARPPPSVAEQLPALAQRLRAQGIKWRDTTSFGLPGEVRLSVQSPSAQAALRRALTKQ